MKAAVLTEFNQPFRVEEIELDSPRNREVRVQVKASGLCHSDRHIQLTDPEQAANVLGLTAPLVAGHEVAGIVTEIGPDVQELKVGDHVVSNLISYCGVCEECVKGHVNSCWHPEAVRRTNEEPARLTQNGKPVFQMADLSGFAEEMLVHENSVVKVPKEIPFDRACLLGCGVITGAGAVINATDLGVGDTAAIIGCGGVGLNTIQAAHLAGAKTIIAIDLSPEKLELAKKFGATHTINSGEVKDLAAAVRELTNGRGVNYAFEVIGLKVTAEQAWSLLRTRGTFVQVGMHKPGVELSLPTMPDMLQGQKALQSVYMGQSNPKLDIPMYAEFYLQGRFNLDDLVSRRIRIDQIDQAYEELEGGAIARNVIVFD
ncbi:MAG: Zn-dependent alcohol dehydrogenase [Gulosibacter sp.]|uniref:Zn-dependent alcohol dehydrogenase n=1 Tax=Gulosibacter sp. TaxID=2817531 RepID=UPI003F930C56